MKQSSLLYKISPWSLSMHAFHEANLEAGDKSSIIGNEMDEVTEICPSIHN